MRYLKRLADYDYALDRGMIPLGSCTMKLNAATEMEAVTWPEFGGIHPFAPRADPEHASAEVPRAGEPDDPDVGRGLVGRLVCLGTAPRRGVSGGQRPEGGRQHQEQRGPGVTERAASQLPPSERPDESPAADDRNAHGGQVVGAREVDRRHREMR